MSNFLPFNCNQHLEYHPIQLVPPLSHHVQPSNVPSQQHLQPQPRSIQPSPQPNEQSISQSQTPIPTPGLIYPQSPFEWVLSSITALLQTHHQSVVSKLNETVDQQKSLASKIATLQQTTETLQQTVNTIQADMQGVSAKVARLGADMSSRDATLAGRLNALDDAIEACISDGKLAGASVSGAHGALQTPPASDVQPTDPGSQPGAPEPQPQQEDTIAQEIADYTALSTQLAFDNSSSTLSSLSQLSPVSKTQSQQHDPLLEPVLPLVKPNGGDPQTPANTFNSNKPNQTQLPKARRSSRPSKKRQRFDGTVEKQISNKKPKGDGSVGGMAPRRTVPRFDWSSVPRRDEELEQLIYCDKCDRSFHWGCVNIAANDPILQAETWWCPPCAFEESYGIVSRRARATPKDGCRPGCPVKHISDELFAIESIIGRFPHSVDPTGNTMQYLIKWEDYPVQRATWTPENEIGLAAHALICEFEKVAESEGLNPSDRSELILLREAKDAGWGYNTFPAW